MKQNTKNSLQTMLERNFAAVGLAEGNRDIARQYLASEPTSSLWKKAEQVYASGQSHFTAAALAEGCPDTARRYMEQNLDYTGGSTIANLLSKIKKWSQTFEQSFAAAGLAEGDPELAHTYLTAEKTQKSCTRHSFKQFLSTTGLKGVQYQYGLLAA